VLANWIAASDDTRFSKIWQKILEIFAETWAWFQISARESSRLIGKPASAPT